MAEHLAEQVRPLPGHGEGADAARADPADRLLAVVLGGDVARVTEDDLRVYLADPGVLRDFPLRHAFLHLRIGPELVLAGVRGPQRGEQTYDDTRDAVGHRIPPCSDGQ